VKRVGSGRGDQGNRNKTKKVVGKIPSSGGKGSFYSKWQKDNLAETHNNLAEKCRRDGWRRNWGVDGGGD